MRGATLGTPRIGFQMESDVTVHHATFFQVFLVVFLGLPEDGGREDLCGDGLAVGSGGVEFRDAGACLSGLLVGAGEDDAAVLRAEVGTLTIDLSWIVHGEEGVEQRVVRKTAIVEGYFHYFRVAGAVGTDFLVGRVFEAASCVSSGRIEYTS